MLWTSGVFSTARDVSLYAQALLDRLAGRQSEFPLKHHLRGSPPIQDLRGEVATATAEALRLYGGG